MIKLTKLLSIVLLLLSVFPTKAQAPIEVIQKQILGQGNIHDSQWSPDGTMIGIGGELGLWIYSDELQLINYIETDPVQAITWSQDSTQIVAQYVNKLQVWNIVSEQVVFTRAEPSCPVAFSPDNQKLAIGKANNEIDVVDTTSWQNLFTYQGHVNEDGSIWEGIRALAWSRDSQSVMSIGTTNVLHTWNVISGEVQSQLTLEDFFIDAPCSNWIEWDPTASKIFNFGWNGEDYGIWDTTTGSRLASSDDNLVFPLFLEVTWSPDAKQLAMISPNQEIVLWDVDQFQPVHSYYPYAVSNVPEEYFYIRELDYSLDWHDNRILFSTVGDVRVVDAATGAVLHTMSEFSGSVNSVRWNADGTRLLGGYGNRSDIDLGDNRFRVWNIDSGELIVSCEVFSGFVRIALWSETQDKIIVTSSQGNPYGAISKWDLSTCTLEHYISGSLGAPYASMNDTINLIVIGDAFNTTDIVTEEFELESRIETFSSVVEWDNAGSQLAQSRISNVWITSWPEQAQTVMETVHEGFVNDLAWSGDDSQLASLDRNGKIAVWSIENDTTDTFDIDGATSIDWHPFQPWLAIGNANGTLQIWDVEHNMQIAVGETDLGEIRDAEWSPDGNQLATAHSNGQIIIWQVAE